MGITIAYVGLSNGELLSQCHEFVALEGVSEKAAMLNRKKSPIQYPELDDHLKNQPLSFRALFDKKLLRIRDPSIG